MTHVHRKRRRTYHEPGHAHCLTYSCVNRWPLLSRDATREWVVEAIGTARRRHHFDVHAYVVMPEHVHLLVRPKREEADLPSFLRDLKRPVSWEAKKYLEETGRRDWLDSLTFTHGSRSVFRFWQPGGGFDRNITELAALWEVCQYMHGNPVRRGLVQEPLGWKWSSARFWAGCEDTVLEMDPLP